MTGIVYDGMADVQEFSKDDFAKAKVEGKKVSFKKGEVTEVDDAVAKLLLDPKDTVFEGFPFREPKKGDVGFDDIDEALDEEKNAQAGKKIDPDTTGQGAALQESTGETGTAGMPGAGGGRISTT
jgi:hypothetical protein